MNQNEIDQLAKDFLNNKHIYWIFNSSSAGGLTLKKIVEIIPDKGIAFLKMSYMNEHINLYELSIKDIIVYEINH